MRKILHEEFWRVARDQVSKEDYQNMVEAFRGQKTEKDIADVELRFKRQGIIMARAAALNGCDCPGDNEEYYARMFEILRRAVGDEILTDPDIDLKGFFEINKNISEQLQADVAALGDEFDSLKKSHPTYDGYICH
jgi:hypothetical protein